jgi:four helix bundle protein
MLTVKYVRATMQNYRNLIVWQKAHLSAVNIHRSTESIPRNGNTALITQIRRAALSISSNLAEGCGRASDADFAKCVHVAIGSSLEVECQLQFAFDTALIHRVDFENRQKEIVEVRRMMIGLLKKLRPAAVS